MAAVAINFAANGSQEMSSADMRHRRKCGRIKRQKRPGRFDLSHDLSHMRETGCVGKCCIRRLIWINAPKNQRPIVRNLWEEAFMLASNPAKTDPAFSSVFASFRGWLRNRKLMSQCRQRLDACDKNEIARIARDVGLSPHDLREMAALGPDAAKQLLDRMDALHLDADALAKSDPTTMRDLQRLCSNCVSKKRC
ncbi:MAG: hypothetical protein ACHP82_09465, partial [Hyphomicrobiales bacterium]